MVKTERFEDIEAWRKAREIFARDFGLRDQVQRYPL
jgi:hypothetical protein